MLSLGNKKRIAGALAMLSLCGLTLGCDDGHHRPPRHTERRDQQRGRDGYAHRTPPNHGRNDHGRRDNPNGGRHHHALVGSYRARALNDAVVDKGTTFPVSVIEGDDASLFLALPTGEEYAIRFDEATGKGTVAGGTISLREDGLFVYTDAEGGIWLIEKQ